MLELGVDGPVFLRHESRDLVFALANHAQRRTLHAARRQTGSNFLPQQGRQIEAHQEIERAPGLLRIDEVDRQLARLRHGFAHRVLGDLVEHDALHVLALERALGLQQLVQMPGDGLALAVRVGREIQRFRLLQRSRYGIDMLLIAFDDLILHGEMTLRIDGALFRHQIPHVTVGGEHLEVLAEVLLDGLRLGRRLHDNEIAAQSRLMQGVGALFEDQVFHLRVGGLLARAD